MSRIRLFTKLDWLTLTAMCIKAATGVVGGSMIIQAKYPYATLAVVSVGAMCNEFVQMVKSKEVKKIAKEDQEEEGA